MPKACLRICPKASAQDKGPQPSRETRNMLSAKDFPSLGVEPAAVAAKAERQRKGEANEGESLGNAEGLVMGAAAASLGHRQVARPRGVAQIQLKNQRATLDRSDLAHFGPRAPRNTVFPPTRHGQAQPDFVSLRLRAQSQWSSLPGFAREEMFLFAAWEEFDRKRTLGDSNSLELHFFGGHQDALFLGVQFT